MTGTGLEPKLPKLESETIVPLWQGGSHSLVSAGFGRASEMWVPNSLHLGSKWLPLPLQVLPFLSDSAAVVASTVFALCFMG